MTTSLAPRRFSSSGGGTSATYRPPSVAVLLTALLLVLLTGGPVQAAGPGRGQLTFMRQDSQGFWQVWVADTDLEHQRQLTRGAANSGWPVWSPDGRRIAFDSDRADPDPDDPVTINDVFTMRPDGTGVTKLTDSTSLSSDAGWSPDGARIAFSSDRADVSGRQSIFTMRADGGQVRRVTQ